jgi:hypothetical protein
MRSLSVFLVICVGSDGNGLPPAAKLHLTGDAKFEKHSVRLTEAKPDQGGSAWLSSKQFVRGGFETRFAFRFTNQGGLGKGADGLAFVIHNGEPRALGGIGGLGGFGFSDGSQNEQRRGIPFSLAVFFDSYRNREYRDPSDNALHVCINGTAEDKWPPSRLAVAPKLRMKLKDGREHQARVVYQPPLLSVYLDEERLVQTPADLSLVTDADGRAWVGFTASTGGGWENHDLLAWDWSSSAESSISMVDSSISFVLKACLPGRNLCTPEEPIAEEKGPSLYHVVLPAHLEWEASIPNAAGTPVEIFNARGLVCWDSSKGQAGCGGPEAGVLSRNTGGRTQFSIRDEGRNFADNQGYLEFDVRLR